MPGRPSVLRTPRELTFTVAPGMPKLALRPREPRFRRTPGKSLKDCLNLSPTRSPIQLDRRAVRLPSFKCVPQ